MDFLTTIGILALIFIPALYYEKWKKAGPSQGRGLTGVSMDYFLRISYLTQSLQENLRKYLLEEAYHTITKYQKSYSPKQNIKFLHILFNDKYKDTVRIDCFAISFILCDRLRSYGSDDIGRKMAIQYYNDLESRLGKLYDFCVDNNQYFPGEIVDCFCSDGYRILEENSKYFAEKNHK